MRKDDISRLLQQYITAKEEGKEPYFDADDLNDLLDSLEESEDYNYYDEVLALGLKLHPYNTALQIKKCRQIADNEGYEKALYELEKIAEPENQDLDMLRMECYCALNRFPEVMIFLQGLQSRECEYLEDIYEYLAPILNDFNMKDEADELIRKGLSIFPENLILKKELCYLLEGQDKLEEAIKICNELIDKNPFSYDSWFFLGKCYSLEGNFEKAVEAFDFALTCDKEEHTDLKLLKAYCLYMNKSYEKAIEAYSDLELDKNNEDELKPIIADCYIKLAQYRTAYNLLRDYFIICNIKKKKIRWINYINFLRCCAEMRRHEEVAAVIKEAAQTYPNNTRILSLYTFYLFDINNKEKGLAVMKKTMQLLSEEISLIKPEDLSRNLMDAGMKSFAAGNYDMAIESFEKAQKLADINYPSIYLIIAMSYLAKHDIPNFISNLRQGSEVDNMFDFYNEVDIFSASIFESENAKEEEEEENDEMVEPILLALQYINNKDNSN